MIQDLQNLLGLISVVLLAIPAWHVNRYALLLARLSPKVEVRSAAFEQRRADLQRKFQAHRDDWVPWKSWCLIVGTIAAGLSAAVPFLPWLLKFLA